MPIETQGLASLQKTLFLHNLLSGNAIVAVDADEIDAVGILAQ